RTRRSSSRRCPRAPTGSTSPMARSPRGSPPSQRASRRRRASILRSRRRGAESAAVDAAESAQQLRRYLQRLDLDPARLAELDARIRAVMDAARKYRVEAAELAAALAERRARLAELGGEESLEQLREQERAAEKAYRELAVELSKARRGAAQRLGTEVTRTLQRLAMTGGR